MENFGLTLCGGGAKGAFQIGAMKELISNGTLDKVTHISGTSVGALNAVLYAMGDFEYAREIWMRTSPEISPVKNLDSQKALKKLLESVDYTRLGKSAKKVYVNYFKKKENKNIYTCINGMNKHEIIKILLASTAIPVLYPEVEVDGIKYRDSGINPFDNTPVEPLYKNDCRDILIIALDYQFNKYDVINTNLTNMSMEKINLNEKYKGCNFNVIKPAVNLGLLFTGTANFNRTNIVNMMVQGNKDAQKYYEGEHFYMKQNKTNINSYICKLLEEKIRTVDDLKDFVNKADLNYNWHMSTLGGNRMYRTIFVIDNWKVQSHNGNNEHYRILDNNNMRVAWVMSNNKFITALENYKLIQDVMS